MYKSRLKKRISHANVAYRIWIFNCKLVSHLRSLNLSWQNMGRFGSSSESKSMLTEAKLHQSFVIMAQRAILLLFKACSCLTRVFLFPRALLTWFSASLCASKRHCIHKCQFSRFAWTVVKSLALRQGCGALGITIPQRLSWPLSLKYFLTLDLELYMTKKELDLHLIKAQFSG